MPELDFKIEYAAQKNVVEKNALPVIIVAAGSASRMCGINKIFATICNVPLIVHTLRAFERSGYISRIIIVARQEDILKIQLITENYNITKVSDIVAGGKNRQESVKNGFSRLANGEESVLIHDGARPVVSDKIIKETVLALKEHKSVACAVPSKDTVKRIDGNGIVCKTLNRDELVCVQTPQGVRVKEYRTALENTEFSAFTDDTSIMESIGEKTIIIPGDYHNIKITTPEDLIIAEHYLKGEE